MLALALASCGGDDPELVEKLEKQKAEVTRLRGELALIEEKLKYVPEDVSGELAKAEDQAEEQAGEIGRLEDEIASLQERKSSLQEEFDAYRQKYQIK